MTSGVLPGLVAKVAALVCPAATAWRTVLESAAESWWVQGRIIDPATGFDTRMSPEAERTGRVG